MDWLYESKDFQWYVEKQDKREIRNGLSYKFIAALTVASVFGHITSVVIRGEYILFKLERKSTTCFDFPILVEHVMYYNISFMYLFASF